MECSVVGNRKWREGKSSPYTGKRSARPAGKPGDFLIAKEVCDDPFPATFFASASTILRALSMRFGGMAESFWSDGVFKIKTKPWGGNRPPPDGRPQTQVKERAGRITLFLIVRR